MYSIAQNKYSLARGVAAFGLAVAFFLTMADTQQAQTTGTAAMKFTATFTNVDDSESEISFDILRWSTNVERGELISALNPPPPPAVPAEAPAGGRGGRGGRGGGGRGAAPADPIATALDEVPTVGYIWTDSAFGYSIKYAHSEQLPDGGERIVLATKHRLASRTPAEDEFTLIEIRLDAGGLGEGRTSLISQARTDSEAETVVLENYDGTPAILQNVRR